MAGGLEKGSKYRYRTKVVWNILSVVLEARRKDYFTPKRGGATIQW